jgi:hypothetical protein
MYRVVCVVWSHERSLVPGTSACWWYEFGVEQQVIKVLAIKKSAANSCQSIPSNPSHVVPSGSRGVCRAYWSEYHILSDILLVRAYAFCLARRPNLQTVLPLWTMNETFCQENA